MTELNNWRLGGQIEWLFCYVLPTGVSADGGVMQGAYL